MTHLPSLPELLRGWSCGPVPRRGANELPTRPLWDDGAGLTISSLDDGRFRVECSGVIRLLVDLPARRIEIEEQGTGAEPPQSTIDHWLFDQLVPRIRSHHGALVIHAAAVAHGERCLLLMGESGRGKSTLSAALASLGGTLLGDDAAILAVAGDRIMASAIYPSLRLLPDSIAALYGSARTTSPTAHYTAKRRVGLESGAAATLPVAALILLAKPDPGCTEVRLRRIEPARACMEIVRESFALDPSDTARAAARLAEAGRIAEAIPAYELDYPRAYSRLEEVGRTLLDLVEGLE